MGHPAPVSDVYIQDVASWPSQLTPIWFTRSASSENQSDIAQKPPSGIPRRGVCLGDREWPLGGRGGRTSRKVESSATRRARDRFIALRKVSNPSMPPNHFLGISPVIHTDNPYPSFPMPSSEDRFPITGNCQGFSGGRPMPWVILAALPGRNVGSSIPQRMVVTS